MPLPSISRGFKDISLSFKRHPITNDIIPLKNEDAIKRSVQNLVRIQVGEVFFDNLLGTRITGSLFELASKDFTDPIQTEIETVITNFEPRVNLLDVVTAPYYDQNAFNVSIKYEIIGIDVPAQQLDFVLQPTR